MVADPLTADEAARIVGISPGGIRFAIRAGLLSARKIGRDWLIDRAEAERYANSDRRPGPKSG